MTLGVARHTEPIHIKRPAVILVVRVYAVCRATPFAGLFDKCPATDGISSSDMRLSLIPIPHLPKLLVLKIRRLAFWVCNNSFVSLPIHFHALGVVGPIAVVFHNPV
jgi:hypothetical protein